MTHWAFGGIFYSLLHLHSHAAVFNDVGESPPIMRLQWILDEFDWIQLCLFNIEYVCRYVAYIYMHGHTLDT